MNLNNSTLITSDQFKLVHRVSLPENANFDEPVPIVILVHGYAGNEDVMWIFRQIIPNGVAIITPRAIIPLPENEYCWFEHDGEHRVVPDPTSLQHAIEVLHQFIIDLPNHYPVDLSQLVMMGFSQGAAMCNSLALVWPDLLQGVASIAGILPDLPDIAPYPDLLIDLPIFIAHGLKDETVPLNMAHYTRDSYRQLGAEVTYGEYNVGHKINTQALKDLQVWTAQRFTPRSV
ncbi:hypothetical protein QUF63_03915 [Anaerolineales bacterium HSG25]|nr:hypothetical protein [Anaerolineales bacterium HSG25]